jgi:putative flippase GtrA
MRRIWHLIQQRHPAFKFALVGSSGFLVDATVLILLFEVFKLDLITSRSIAFVLAATSNWILNRVFTFVDADRGGLKSTEWLRFITSAVISALPNLGLFFLLMQLLPETLPAIIFAMCCGILAGYACNYHLAKSWVYKSAKS